MQGIVIVDNASSEAVQLGLQDMSLRFDAVLIQNTQNFGVAKALNQGIAQARDQYASHVLLMDQDSLPSHDMVAKLQAALTRLSAQEKLAQSGPWQRIFVVVS